MASFGGTYDSRIARAKRQIDDALGLPQRVSPLGPPPNQRQPAVRGQAGPMAQQMPAGAPNPGAPFGAPPMGAQQPMAARFAGMQAGVQGQAGPVSLGAQGQLGPRGGFQGVSGNASMPMAGGNVGVNAALDDEMKLRMLQARYQRGPVSVSGGYAPGAGFGGEMRYEGGPFAVSGGYDPARGANVSLGVRRQFQEGGLATSLRVDPTLREQDMEFVNTRNQHMRELTGKTPYAKGGGAWTRKEGKNPEGGLNAKGRASLKAQGQDIKPPVSAKQAKTSPKAAARRSSFCARMGGMEGPMKDEKGRPTRKALALRKWDCKAQGGAVEVYAEGGYAEGGYAEGGKSRVNEAGNYTKPTMRKALFSSIKSGGKGGAPGQWSARKAQMLAQQYKEKGGGYRD